MTIYKAHIRSILEYGVNIKRKTSKLKLKKNDTIQQWFLTSALAISILAKKDDVRKKYNIKSLQKRREIAILIFCRKKFLQNDNIFLELDSQKKR